MDSRFRIYRGKNYEATVPGDPMHPHMLTRAEADKITEAYIERQEAVIRAIHEKACSIIKFKHQFLTSNDNEELPDLINVDGQSPESQIIDAN